MNCIASSSWLLWKRRGMPFELTPDRHNYIVECGGGRAPFPVPSGANYRQIAFWRLDPPERTIGLGLAIDRLQEGGDGYDQYETVRLRKDGVRVPVELTVSPINDADGTVLGVTTACRDITVRQHYEEALRESEERFSKVFKLAPIAMSISTLDEGRYLDVNEALLAVTGYSREEVVGHTARDLKVFADPEDAIRIASYSRAVSF